MITGSHKTSPWKQETLVDEELINEIHSRILKETQ